jgi:tetratricopeptide (TPR) repeat protein
VSERFQTVRLDEIERAGTSGHWMPLRRRLGIEAFGVNAWGSAEEGAEIIGEHDEVPSGHEELYVVISGHAVFTVDGEEIDAPTGTAVFVQDPAVKRAARTAAGGATILTVGAKPGEAYRVQHWEEQGEILPLFETGEHAEAKRQLQALVEKYPDAAGPVYNLACAEAMLGEHEPALEHLLRAVEVEPVFADYAQSDSDLASIRSDPRFPAAAS